MKAKKNWLNTNQMKQELDFYHENIFLLSDGKLLKMQACTPNVVLLDAIIITHNLHQHPTNMLRFQVCCIDKQLWETSPSIAMETNTSWGCECNNNYKTCLATAKKKIMVRLSGLDGNMQEETSGSVMRFNRKQEGQWEGVSRVAVNCLLPLFKQNWARRQERERKEAEAGQWEEVIDTCNQYIQF